MTEIERVGAERRLEEMRREMRSELAVALEREIGQFEQTAVQRVEEALVRWGVSVVIRGEPPTRASEIGMLRWSVELELFPICVQQESDVSPLAAMSIAVARLLKEVDRRPLVLKHHRQ